MILPGHVAAGYLITKAVLFSNPQIGGTEADKMLLLGAFSGWMPDLDLIYHFIKAKSLRFQSSDTHRSYITHTPFFWVLIGLIVYFTTQNSILFSVISLSAISHILLDSFGSGHGLMWLWPFSKRKFSFFVYVDKNPETKTIAHYYLLLLKEYSKHLTFYMEIILTIIAFLVLLR